MSSLLPALAALVGTLAGVAATYLLGARRTSGRIATSDAAVLWEASESIRHDLTAEVAALRAEGVQCLTERMALRVEVATLRLELAQLRSLMEA